jgi:hypothetical protein
MADPPQIEKGLSGWSSYELTAAVLFFSLRLLNLIEMIPRL